MIHSKSRSLLPTLAVLLAAFGSGGAAHAQDLTMGNVNPPKHGTSLATQQFIDKLGEVSAGKIKVADYMADNACKY